MSSPILVPPYLVTSRKFSSDISLLDTTLSKMYFDIATAVNYREIAIYDRFEVTTGQQWYNDKDIQKRRQAFRRIYTLDSIANGTSTIATNIKIDVNTEFTHIYGTANSNSSNLSVPIPYLDVTNPADGITIKVNRATKEIEIVTTTSNYSSFSATIVLEYILNS